MPFRSKSCVPKKYIGIRQYDKIGESHWSKCRSVEGEVTLNQNHGLV